MLRIFTVVKLYQQVFCVFELDTAIMQLHVCGIIGAVWIRRRMKRDEEKEEDEDELIDGNTKKRKDRYSFQELLQDWKEREKEAAEKSELKQ